jgi:apolipoprotein N-acyltransferase
MLFLCFPPAGIWPVAWISLVPWLVALHMGGRRAAALGSWVGGFVFFGGMLYWLARFGLSAWAVACLLLSLPLMLWGICVWWTRGLRSSVRVIGTAALWCAVEWVRGEGQYGFTWGWLGYSQSPALAVLAVARVAGTIGVSLIIVLVNAALAEAALALIRREPVAGRAIHAMLACSFAGLCVAGAGRWARRQGGPSGPTVRVAVIQGSPHGELRPEQVNVPLTQEEVTRTMGIYQGFTERVAEEMPSLVVWPESVLPGAPGQDPAVAEWLARSAQEANAWLIAGGPYYDDRGRLYNSAFLIAPSGHLVARYDKVHLVPFGEYVPARRWLPFLDRYNVREVDFAAGAVHRLLQTEAMTLGPMICFESTFPRISREHVRRGAQVLVIITNDAWFGRSGAAAQHRQIAVLRAVETNRWVVRGASTGISSIIAPDGRIVAEAGLFERSAIAANVRLARPGRRRRESAPKLPWVLLLVSAAYIIAPAVLPHARPAPRAVRPRIPRRRPG